MAEARWLLIVDREHPELHDLLSRVLRGEPRATILWERRQGTSPTPGAPGSERRRTPSPAAAGACYVAATTVVIGAQAQGAVVAPSPWNAP